MGLLGNNKKKENVLSEESAKEQLDLLLDYYGMDSNDMPEEHESTVKEIIRAIQSGAIEVKENEGVVTVIQNLVSGQTLEYKGVDLASAKMAMKAAKVDDHYGRIYALTGSLSGVGIDGIKKLAPKDLSITESLGVIFL
jgi:hypothetical protein